MASAASVKSIFNEALELEPAHRPAFLDRACGGDAAVRAKVEELLAVYEGAGRFLGSPTAATMGSSALLEGPGTQIGPYKLLQLIGEGGFGSVFMAEQREPVVRRVALKIIKLGMDTRQVIARFEAERQALAMMEHPNIARVLDAGATEAGRPYFVMELVRGEAITRYCDQNNLSVPARLELFAHVCRAVQHAHTKGIIHRDIKPTNVLVTIADGKPIPKVIDFGIAKATSARLTEKTLFTEHRALIGTPEYMSPEQAQLTGVDIDTRSDVYSLGVLLYELLTGAVPFDPERLRSAAFGEIQRIIREEEPARPSTRLSGLGALPSVAAQRSTEPARLGRMVRGDLDWIVMKCLEKDRARRYETAAALADDITRHLDNQPVHAGPPSARYRAGKFIRRHRFGVLAGAAITAALLLGLAGATVGLVRAETARAAEAQQRALARSNELLAREEAERAEREAQRALAAEAEANARAAELTKVAEFQASQLAGIDVVSMGVRLRSRLLEAKRAVLQRGAMGSEQVAAASDAFERELVGVNFTNLALEMLDKHIFERTMAAIEGQFEDQPLVKARLSHTIAVTLRTLGLLEQAMGPQTAALEIRRRLLGDDHVDTLNTINSLGLLLVHRGRFAEAEPYCREAEARARARLGPDHPDTLITINTLGLLLKNKGEVAEAERCYREALERSRRVLGDDHSQTLNLMNNLGALLRSEGKFDEAELLFRQALAGRRRALGDDHHDTLTSINNLGLMLQYHGRFDEAEPYCTEVVERIRRVLGDQHPHTLIAVNNLGQLLRVQGRLADAEPLALEAMTGMRRILGEEHPNTLNAIGNMAALRRAQGEHAAAEAHLREILETRRRVIGPDSMEAIDTLSNLGQVLREQGRHAEAEQLGAEAIRLARSGPMRNHWFLGLVLLQHGRTLLEMARFVESEQELLESHAVFVPRLGDQHMHARSAASALAELYDAWHAAEPDPGRAEQAAAWRARLDVQHSDHNTPGQPDK